MSKRTADEINAQQPDAAPKAKRARKTIKKVKGTEVFLETTDEERRLLDINKSLDVCLEDLNVREFVQKTRESKDIPKINIPITNDFVMTVQNVVMTVEIMHKKPPMVTSTTNSSKAPQPSQWRREGGYIPNNYTNPPQESTNTTTTAQSSILTSNLRLIGTGGLMPSLDELIDSEGEDVRNAANNSNGKKSKNNSSLLPYYIPLDQLTLYWRHYGAQHNNRRFTAVILRDHEFNAAGLVFSSGNIVCTGCSRSETALWLIHSILDKIRKAGYDKFEIPHPRLRNIVSSGRFPNRLCTSLLAILYSNCCRRAEKFPGTMISHPKTGNRVALVFDSGKICISGAHSCDEIKHDIKIIYPMLVRCQYTVKNQKHDDECAKILDMTKHHDQRETAITQMCSKIEAEYEQHQKQVQEKRSQSAQLRAKRIKAAKAQQQTNQS